MQNENYGEENNKTCRHESVKKFSERRLSDAQSSVRNESATRLAPKRVANITHRRTSAI
jgi:hypothetical protein